MRTLISCCLASYDPDDLAAIARRKLAEPADRQDGVEHGHALAIGNRLGRGDLPEHPHLAERADGIGDDYVDLRRADVLRKHRLDVARQLRGRLADGDHVLDQRGRNLAVGPHRYGRGQLRIAPDEDLQAVTRADDVLAASRPSRPLGPAADVEDASGGGSCAASAGAPRPARRIHAIARRRVRTKLIMLSPPPTAHPRGRDSKYYQLQSHSERH